MSAEPTTHLQRCLDRLRAGDEAARDELLQSACARLSRLTHNMLQDYPGVRRWEETDDVLQNALLRLWRALHEVTPSSVRDFCRLAALQIRSELIDLARHYQGQNGGKEQQATAGPGSGSESTPPSVYEKPNSSCEPSRLAIWSEFHQQVEALPEAEKEAFDLLWYQGLSQAEAATLLQVDVRTVKRRWQAARLKLARVLPGALPES